MNKMKLGQIFSEFIQVVQEYQHYIIGLLDKDGQITFCSAKDRIGNQVNIQSPTDNDFIYKVAIRKREFGYLWVNSEDTSVGIVGNLLAESLKTRITYELNEEAIRQTVSIDDRLIKALIDEESFDTDLVLELMNELNFDVQTPRVAIYVQNEKGFDPEEITRLKYRTGNKDSIHSLLTNDSLLFFKNVPEDLSNMSVREHITEFIRELQEWGFDNCHYIVGSLQKKIRLYATSYKNCRWVRKNIDMVKDVPLYFEDYIFNFFASQLRSVEIEDVFDYYKEKSRSIDIDEMIEISEMLYIHDYNITQTAQSLFLHKNTLIYKIKRYEEIFNLDLRGSFQGKILFYLLANFFREEKKRKQVGAKL